MPFLQPWLHPKFSFAFFFTLFSKTLRTIAAIAITSPSLGYMLKRKDFFPIFFMYRYLSQALGEIISKISFKKYPATIIN